MPDMSDRKICGLDPLKPERTPTEIMFDALTEIAHSNGFFNETKAIIEIARRAIREVHNSYKK